MKLILADLDIRVSASLSGVSRNSREICVPRGISRDLGAWMRRVLAENLVYLLVGQLVVAASEIPFRQCQQIFLFAPQLDCFKAGFCL